MTKKIIQADGNVHLFCDATLSKRKDKLGIAWVIACEYPQNPIVGTQENTNENVISSDISGIIGKYAAVVYGLKSVPDGGKVIIHTNCPSVYEAINDILRTGKITDSNPIIAGLLKTMMPHFGRLDKIDIEMSHDNTQEPSLLKRTYMATARTLACDIVDKEPRANPTAPEAIANLTNNGITP